MPFCLFESQILFLCLFQHQQEDGALTNSLSYRTQEADLHSSQRPDRPDYQPPYQEAGVDQVCEYNVPVQNTDQVAGQQPDEHEYLPPCYRQLNVANINGVSSTGQADQAIVDSCSLHEIRLWTQTLARQATLCLLYLTLFDTFLSIFLKANTAQKCISGLSA